MSILDEMSEKFRPDAICMVFNPDDMVVIFTADEISDIFRGATIASAASTARDSGTRVWAPLQLSIVPRKEALKPSEMDYGAVRSVSNKISNFLASVLTKRTTKNCQDV